jgi:hypothetical protein
MIDGRVGGPRLNVSTFISALIFSISIVASACGSDATVSASQDSPAVPTVDGVAIGAPPSSVGPSAAPGPTVPRRDTPQQQAAQDAANAAMVWVGEAYRTLVRDGAMTDGGVRQLSGAYDGRALRAETAVYREYARDVNALAKVPGDPLLLVDRVQIAQPRCYVVSATFDENPILAFPTDSGISVVAVLREQDGFWKITTLTRDPGRDRNERIDCATQ